MKLYEHQIKWESGIPKINRRRKLLYLLYSDEHDEQYATHCCYCGSNWKIYQNECHNFPDCQMASKDYLKNALKLWLNPGWISDEARRECENQWRPYLTKDQIIKYTKLGILQ